MMLHAKLDQKMIIDTYTSTAKIYDLWAALTETKARNKAIQFASPQGSESILEVAVGTGLTFEALVKHNLEGKNYGVDLTPAMLEKAKKRMIKGKYKNYELTIGNAEKLNFADKSFDLVVNNYMFDLLPEENFIKVLTEFKRILKPSGRLVLTNMAIGQKISHTIFNKVYQLSPKLMGGCRGVKLTSYLEKTGFIVDDYHYQAQFGFPSEIIKARL